MDIRKYFGKRTCKQQSDKSSGEESDAEESLCHVDKSEPFMTCPISNNYHHNKRRNVTRKS